MVAIEKQSFEFAWSEQVFLNCLRQRNCICTVAEQHDQIVGYMVYESIHAGDVLHILNFATAPWARRQGIGTHLMDKLISKLANQNRQQIILEVRESNLAAQLFFKSCGCRAIEVLHKHYADTDEDAYQMLYEVQS